MPLRRGLFQDFVRRTLSADSRPVQVRAFVEPVAESVAELQAGKTGFQCCVLCDSASHLPALGHRAATVAH